MRQVVLDRLDQTAVMLPVGYARRIGELQHEVHELASLRVAAQPSPDESAPGSTDDVSITTHVRRVLRPRTRLKAFLHDDK